MTPQPGRKLWITEQKLMTITDLIKQKPERFRNSEKPLFEAQDEQGFKHLFCVESFRSREEIESMITKFPTLPTWEVTEEYFSYDP